LKEELGLPDDYGVGSDSDDDGGEWMAGAGWMGGGASEYRLGSVDGAASTLSSTPSHPPTSSGLKKGGAAAVDPLSDARADVTVYKQGGVTTTVSVLNLDRCAHVLVWRLGGWGSSVLGVVSASVLPSRPD